MSQLLYMWENAVTGEQSNNKEFATDYYCYGSLCTYTSTHLMWRERLEMSSLNLKGILMEAMEASSMRGFPAMHVARMSSCSLCRSIRSVICPGRLLPLGEEPPKSVGKARGRWLRLWINCSRSLHLGKRRKTPQPWHEVMLHATYIHVRDNLLRRCSIWMHVLALDTNRKVMNKGGNTSTRHPCLTQNLDTVCHPTTCFLRRVWPRYHVTQINLHIYSPYGEMLGNKFFSYLLDLPTSL